MSQETITGLFSRGRSLLGRLSPSAPRNHHGLTSLVTGASSGLGAEFARQLATQGSHLVLVARRRDRLESLAQELREQFGVSVHVLPCDLSTSEGVGSLIRTLEEKSLRIDSLINAAGFGVNESFTDMNDQRLQEMLEVNVLSLTMLTKALLPQLLDSQRGVLVNIASAVAYQPVPGMAAYSASKAYVLSLTEAIAEEVRENGLRVLALSPGATRTEFFDVAGHVNLNVRSFETATQVVNTAFKALERPQPRSVVSGMHNKVMTTATKLMPRRLVLSAVRKILN